MKPSCAYRIKLRRLMIVLILLLFPMATFSKNVTAIEQSDLTGVRVAIYNNQGSDTHLASRIALQNMFLWMGAEVENITASEIRNGGLSGFNIIVMPGRSDSVSYYELESQGVENILSFVRNGGSYFGICGGVLFAARSDVKLFSGVLEAVHGENILAHIVQMRINTHSIYPELLGFNKTFSILFWGSVYFIPDNPQQINTIAEYSSCNESGMISYRYGMGSVFLSSPHGEFEENSERDGTDDFDTNNDTDSEWDLMLRVTQWLVNAPASQITIFWVITIGGAAILASIVILYLKKRRT